jgi:hypothetical protein
MPALVGEFGVPPDGLKRAVAQAGPMVDDAAHAPAKAA